MSDMEETLLIYHSGKPIGKPTMTHSDRYRDPPRPPVVKWREFKAGLQASALEQGFRPGRMEIRALGVVAFFKLPKSWSKKKKEDHFGKIHRSKPDLSNIIKAVEDALTDKDETIGMYLACSKHWAGDSGLSLMLKVVERDETE